jgi:flagellar biosynthesis protein FlhF
VRIKTFQGRSLEEVLPEIRAELGAGAVVVGQRTKVQGGVAGFFGTKVIEVTAADRMPTDDQLVDLEDQLMGGADGAASVLDEPQPGEPDELAERFAGAMKMGRRGGLDVTDEWDPAQDAELAQEYGRVLEHAAAAGFEELDVPIVATSVLEPEPQAIAHDPLAQAQALAARTHAQLQQSTTHMDDAVYAPQMTQTYAPPRALPRTTPVQDRARTFAASVHDTPMQAYEPQALTTPGSAAASVDDALRSDLALTTTAGDELSQAMDAAVDMIDMKAMADLRNAMHVSRRVQDQHAAAAAAAAPTLDPTIQLSLDHVTAQLTDAGVDDDVIESITDIALRHRRPFGGEQDIDTLLRSMVEETIEIRSGFPQLGRSYRIALVGASSSGKTTVAAKLAHGYGATGLHVGILSIVSPDPTVALMGDPRFNGLNVDVRYAASPEQAMHAAEAFAGHDLMIIDTPGSTYLDPATFAQVQACLAAIGVDDVNVVLPLATSSREARALVDAFRPLGANRMVVSRTDESRYIGQLLNFGFRLGVPMTFLSEGPRITGDLCAASAREIAERIVPAHDRHS